MLDHVASFVGFVPAARPAFVVLVSLDTPKGAQNQGGDVAAPLFARIAGAALRLRAVPPEDPNRVMRVATHVPRLARPVAYRPQPEQPPVSGETDPRLMPDLRGRSAREAALRRHDRASSWSSRAAAVSRRNPPSQGQRLGRERPAVSFSPSASGRCVVRAAETLGELAGNVPGAKLTGDPATPVGAVVYDSRRASQGSLFVAIRGLAADGNRFIEAARRKGAVAVASEEPPPAGIPWLRVPDARVALALLSAANLGNPAASCDLVGVTGTNGKTTTTVLIHEVLRAVGDTPGLVGTLHYKVGDQVVDSARTTPESSDLQGLFRKMVDTGCRRVVMEVSSHALALERVAGCYLPRGGLHESDEGPPRLPRNDGRLFRGQTPALRRTPGRGRHGHPECR